MWWTHKLLVWALAAAMAAIGTATAQEALPGLDPEDGSQCLVDENPAHAPELAVGAIGNETISVDDDKTRAGPSVKVAGPVVRGDQNRTCTRPVAQPSAAGGVGGERGVAEEGDTAEEVPEVPESAPAPPNEVTDNVSSLYTAMARVVENNIRHSLPDDPTRPQDADAYGTQVTKDPLGSRGDNPSEEVAPERQNVPAAVREPDKTGATTEPLEEYASSDRPPATAPPGQEPDSPSSESPSISSLTGRNTDTPSNPGPIKIVVITAAAAGTVVLILNFIASHFRVGSSMLRRTLHGIPLLSMLVRIKNHKATEDPKRRALYHAIRNNPGISDKELCEITGLNRGAVRYHVQGVTRANLIVSENIGRGRYHFPAVLDYTRSEKKACVLLRRNKVPDVMRTISERPGITQKSIAEALGQHSGEAHRIVTTLCAAGLVKSHHDGRTVHYFPSGDPIAPQSQ